MPQFDIFSFFSQIFWVFLGFIIFYLFLSFYLLPALSVILKIRKRKLAQTGTGDKSNTLIDTNHNSISIQSNGLIADFSSKLSNVDNVNANPATTLTAPLNSISVKIESFRKLKVSILSQVQLTTFLYV